MNFQWTSDSNGWGVLESHRGDIFRFPENAAELDCILPSDEDATLIAEAFNVTHETGRTPRQLADERGKLLAALKAEVADLLDRNRGSTHWDGCEDAHPKCSALKRMQAAIADAEGGRRGNERINGRGSEGMAENTKFQRREWSGNDNYGKPKSAYVARIATMTDGELYEETKRAIWLSAYAANNPRSDFHWHVDACYYECLAREKPKIYERAFDANTGQ